MAAIIEFYNGEIVHPKGFTPGYIWQWPDQVLESEHTYIQWLFPLTVTSQYVESSPILTADEISEFKASPDLQSRLLRSFVVMLKFYGFSMDEAPDKNGKPRITEGPDFFYKKDNWLTPHNHNLLRISRILGSLTLLGLGRYAIAFHEALLKVNKDFPGIIHANSVEIWGRAVTPH